ncbi:hypothetical protein KC19_3G106700 [Ceratodon purpureus]|uniref:Uncharacterized protein n=1 Tax=Ceratodon purpureus TaxID=3225 RepID=A0A8T0IH51_CERPU|nr:hypothetical protein KC19_3G106700 [Ceratodon purpureus]
MYSQSGESVECLVAATQTMNDQKTTGLLFFFDVQVSYANEEVKYELRMLGLHPLDQPCHSLCMVDLPSKPFTLSPCSMCNLRSLPVADDPWLLDILQCLEHSSKHWSRCCNDRSSDPGALQKDADHVPRGSLLAVGFRGKEYMKIVRNTRKLSKTWRRDQRVLRRLQQMIRQESNHRFL